MPLPMVHLAVTVALSEKESDFPSPDFLLGNLAPDAIHMRPNSSVVDKERVHMLDSVMSPAELAEFFQARYAVNGSRAMGFSLGYLTHLLTDRLWRVRIIAPFRSRLLPTLPDKEIRSIYYHDTDQIDFKLYRQMPWRAEAWARLESATAVEFAPFLTAEEILKWRDRTLSWYADPNHDPQAETVYISLANTLTFIDQTTLEIAGILANSTFRAAY